MWLISSRASRYKKRNASEHLLKDAIARTIVRAYGMLFFVIGVLLLLGALGVLDTREVAQVLLADPHDIQVFMALMALLALSYSVAVRQLWPWTRQVGIAVSVIMILFNGALFLRCIGLCTSALLSTPVNSARIIVGGLGLWFFHDSTVKRLFKVKR